VIPTGPTDQYHHNLHDVPAVPPPLLETIILSQQQKCLPLDRGELLNAVV
jgi:hypothetical protein